MTQRKWGFAECFWLPAPAAAPSPPLPHSPRSLPQSTAPHRTGSPMHWGRLKEKAPSGRQGRNAGSAASPPQPPAFVAFLMFCPLAACAGVSDTSGRRRRKGEEARTLHRLGIQSFYGYRPVSPAAGKPRGAAGGRRQKSPSEGSRMGARAAGQSHRQLRSPIPGALVGAGHGGVVTSTVALSPAVAAQPPTLAPG